MLITAGEIPFNPSEILSSKKMKEFINNLKEVYDYVFIDTPPIGIVTDAGILSTYSDGVAMVVGSGEVSIELAKVSVERLNKINANLIGVILNKFNIEGTNSQYGYYGMYYEEDNGSRLSRNKKNKRKKLNIFSKKK